jgi:hypothetical protein
MIIFKIILPNLLQLDQTVYHDTTGSIELFIEILLNHEKIT